METTANKKAFLNSKFVTKRWIRRLRQRDKAVPKPIITKQLGTVLVVITMKLVKLVRCENNLENDAPNTHNERK